MAGAVSAALFLFGRHEKKIEKKVENKIVKKRTMAASAHCKSFSVW